MANIGKVEGLITLRDEFTGVFDRAFNKLEASGRKLQEVGRKTTELGGALTRSITLPLAAIGTGSVAAFGTFDDAMNSSLAIMGDVSDAMKGQMSDAAREVALSTRKSAKEAADSYFYLASAGLDAEQSLAALPRVAKFAQAGNFDMALATDLLTDAQSALGLTIRDNVVANMNNMARVSDVLVKANTIANASVEQFARSLTAKAGVAMRQLGIEVESGVAVLAAWADQGIKAELAGERFNIVTRDLQTAFLKNRKEFERLNIAVFDSQGNFRSIADIIADIEVAFDGMSQEGQKATLMQLGFTDRSVQATQSLLGLSENIRGYEMDLRAAAGTTEEVSSKQMQSFFAQLGLMKDRIIDLGISLGESLVPMIKDLFPVFESIIGAVKRAIEFFAKLPTPVKVVVVAFAALLAATGPVLVVAGSLITAWGAFAAFLPALGAAIGSIVGVITGPIGWIAAGTALLLAWKPLREFLGKLIGDILVPLGRTVLSTVSNAVKTLIGHIREWWKRTEEGRKFLSNLARVISRDVLKAIESMVDWALKVASAIYDVQIQFLEWTGVLDIANYIIDAHIKALGNMWDWLVKMVDRLGGLGAALALVNPTLGAAVQQLSAWVEEAKKGGPETEHYTSKLDELKEKFKDLTSGVDTSTDSFNNLGSGLGSSADGIRIFKSATEDVIDVVTQSTAALTEHADSALNTREGYELLKRTFDEFQPGSMELVQIIRDLSTAFNEGIITQQQYDAAMERLSNRANDTSGTFTSMAGAFSEAIAKMVLESGSLSEALDNIFGGRAKQMLTEFTNNFIDSFSRGMDSGLGAIESIKGGWKEAKKSIEGTSNAIVAGFAAASGEAEAMWIGAMSAIVNFAQGNWVGAIIAVVGVILGALKKVSAVEKLDKIFESITKGSKAASLGLSVAAGIITDMLSDRRWSTELTARLEEFIDIAIEAGDRGVAALQRVVAAARQHGIGMQKIAELTREKWQEAMDVLAERSQFLIDQSSSMVESLMTLVSSSGSLTVQQIEFAAESALQAFNALVAGGVPVSDALVQIGELFGTIQMRGEQMGVDLGEEFARLGEMMDILADDHIQQVISKLGAMESAAEAAGNTGLLTMSQFDAFGDTLRRTFTELVAGGLSSEEALAALQGPLQLLNDLQEQYGFEIDASTQALLDQAEAQGVVADRGLTSNDILIAGFDRMIEALNRVIVALGGVPVAFDSWVDTSDDMTRRILNDFGDIIDGARELGQELRQLGDDWGQTIEDLPGLGGGAGPGRGGGTGGTLPGTGTGTGGIGQGTGGNLIGGQGVPSFQHGSGRFIGFGRGTVAILHGDEQISPRSEGASIAAMVESAIRRGSSGGGSAILTEQLSTQQRTLQAIDGMRADLGGLISRIATLESRQRTSKTENMSN